MVSQKTVILTGPTGCGKSALALTLATCRPGIEIINADSIQVYKDFLIGAATPSAQDLATAPHHLYQFQSPLEPMSAPLLRSHIMEKISEIIGRGNRPMIVGGNGFYLKALLFGVWDAPPADMAFRALSEKRSIDELYQNLAAFDEVAAKKIGPNDRYRLTRALEIKYATGRSPTEFEKEMPSEPDPQFCLHIVDRAPSEMNARIHQRTIQMIQNGIIQETESLRETYGDVRPLHSVGYQQVLDYLDSRSPPGRTLKPGIDGLRDEIELATRQLVKQQRTWFQSLLKKTGTRWILDDDQIRATQKIISDLFNP